MLATVVHPSVCQQTCTGLAMDCHLQTHGSSTISIYTPPPPSLVNLTDYSNFRASYNRSGQFLLNCRGPCHSCIVSEALMFDSDQAAISCDSLFMDDSSDTPHTFVFAIRSTFDATWHLHSCEFVNQPSVAIVAPFPLSRYVVLSVRYVLKPKKEVIRRHDAGLHKQVAALR
jgi:hypothetical protein